MPGGRGRAGGGKKNNPGSRKGKALAKVQPSVSCGKRQRGEMSSSSDEDLTLNPEESFTKPKTKKKTTKRKGRGKKVAEPERDPSPVRPGEDENVVEEAAGGGDHSPSGGDEEVRSEASLEQALSDEEGEIYLH